MKLGLVGLPNVGKSTLFNAITKAGAEVANYAFCTIEPNLGTVNVPDKRLDFLADLYDPEKYTPATIEFCDIAGLVSGASKGEGLGNKFLADIRLTDALVHVVRCFEDPDVTHVAGSLNVQRDIDTINGELILADIEFMERQLVKAEKNAKSGDKQAKKDLETMQALLAHLESGKPARTFECDELPPNMFLLSLKPVLYAANIAEDDINHEDENVHVQGVKKIAAEENAETVCICAKIEDELQGLDEEERTEFLADYGLEESGLDKIIKAGYKLLGLISYLTAGPKEVRAWTVNKGCKAPAAAGKIHSDFERGFIRAEVVHFNDLKEAGSMAKVKEKGQLRSEGKDYVIQDGDVVLFRFNV